MKQQPNLHFSPLCQMHCHYAHLVEVVQMMIDQLDPFPARKKQSNLLKRLIDNSHNTSSIRKYTRQTILMRAVSCLGLEQHNCHNRVCSMPNNMVDITC